MRLEDLLPSLREGRRARRPRWRKDECVSIDIVADRRSDHMTKKSGACYSTWPSNQSESHDLLADDWELLPELPLDGYIPGHYREAFDILFCEMRSRDFDPYKFWKAKRNPYGRGPEEAGVPDFDWRAMCKQVTVEVGECLEWSQMPPYSRGRTPEEKERRDIQRQAILRMACTAMQALASHISEEYVEQVMES